MEDGRLLFKVQRRRVSEREDALPERDSGRGGGELAPEAGTSGQAFRDEVVRFSWSIFSNYK